MRCADCKFWVPTIADEAPPPPPTIGTCHRYAPRPVDRAGFSPAAASWPFTAVDTFCGDFAAKAVKQVRFV